MKLELRIVELLAKNMEKRFTMNEIAKALKEYYSFVHRIINRLAEDGVIIKNKAGKSYLCSFNIGNEKSLALMQLAEIEKKEELNKELRLILEDFAKSAEYAVSIILFGSYAKGMATKESDIDVLLISKGKEGIDKIAKEIYAKYGKEINVVVMTPDEFKKQREKAIIKEIISSHYVIYGAENFVNLVFKK